MTSRDTIENLDRLSQTKSGDDRHVLLYKANFSRDAGGQQRMGGSKLKGGICKVQSTK